MVDVLETPYIWFGGKRKVAPLIWEILGDVPNYVEPFLGSASILLARPHEPKSESINDFDGFVANFWRSVKYNAEAVAEHCDWPVNEMDLIARQNWLVRQKEFRERMLREPFYFDPQIAGWWCWGLCNWVGGGFCVKEIEVKMPAILDRGILTDDRIKNLYEIFNKLQKRLRLTHVACGDWSRVCTPTITYKRGLTGVVLDPPYGEGKMDYSVGGNTDQKVAKDVQKWAIENGDNPLLRIIYCGYEGQFNPPDNWTVLEWKAQGGYGGGQGTEADVNSYRERLWCSPHCLGKRQSTLFSAEEIGKSIIPVKVKNENIYKEKNSRNEIVIGITTPILPIECLSNETIKVSSEVNDSRSKETTTEKETSTQIKQYEISTKIEIQEQEEEITCICTPEEIAFECLVHNTELREKYEEEKLAKAKEKEEQLKKELEAKELKNKQYSKPPVQNKLF